ncbi:MAG: hypothetical protein AB7F32_08055 [Victivallaceae bacterium]
MAIDYSSIFRRRHALYRANAAVWERSRDAYSGGADYIRQALIKHVSEIDLEYQERLQRACYINYPRKIARTITQFVLSSGPQRENADPALVEDFSRTGLRADEVMRQFSTLLNLYGAAALLVEMPYFAGELDQERKVAERIRPAVRVLSPLEVADWAYGEDGKLNWILIEESDTLDAGPFLPAVEVKRRKLWTRSEYYLFERDSVTGMTAILARGENPLGMVPAVLTVEPDGFGLDHNHYFEDVVRISDAILNNDSESQMNIVKQMFGLLVISDSFARGARLAGNATGRDGEARRFSHVLARSAAIWETPEERGISRYISPSGTDSATIREENCRLKRELFEVVGLGLAPESRQVESAEAKSWDNFYIAQFLRCRVDLIEQAEQAVWAFIAKLDPTVAKPRVVYNRDFAVIELRNSIESLLQLKTLVDGEEFHREIGRAALFMLEKVKKIEPGQRNAILEEIGKGGGRDE